MHAVRHILITIVGGLVLASGAVAGEGKADGFDMIVALDSIAGRLEFIDQEGIHDYYRARLHVLKKNVREAREIVSTESQWSSKPGNALRKMLLHFKFSAVFFQRIETDWTLEAIGEITKLVGEIRERVGSDLPTYIADSLEVILRHYKSIIENSDTSESFRDLLRAQVAQLIDIIAAARASGDRTTAFLNGQAAYQLIAESYNFLYREYPSAIETLEIIGTNEFVGEYVEAELAKAPEQKKELSNLNFLLSDTSQGQLSSRLEALWDIRDQGDTPRCQEEYLNLCLDLGLNQTKPLADRFNQLVEAGMDGGKAQEILLLEAAIWRGRLEIEKASQLMGDLEKICAEKMFPLSGRFHFQEGLNAMAQQHFEKASFFFSLVRRQTENDPLRTKLHLKAYFNLILCLEILGHNISSHLQKFYEIFADSRAEDWARPIHQQLLALSTRSAFDQMDLDRLGAIAKEEDLGQQTGYYLALISSLCWLDFPLGQRGLECLTKLQTEGRQNWLSQYRLNTLRGLLVTQDLKSEVKLDAKIERLYLWTHRWLQDPGGFFTDQGEGSGREHWPSFRR